MNDELKPCPFCGAPATEEFFDGDPAIFWVECSSAEHEGVWCIAGPQRLTRDAAVVAWNTRKEA